MKVLVIGAGGNTGRLIVARCLNAGHRVTALVRDPARVPARENLRVLRGDVLDRASLESAISGQDAVVFAAGTGNLKPSTLRTEGARNVVAMMEQLGVQRLIAISGLGAGESLSRLPFVVRRVIAPLMLRHLLADQNGLEAAIRNSRLDWTLVRPPQMVHRPAKERFRVSLDGSRLGGKIAYDGVAAFVVKHLGSGEYLRCAPGISD